LVAGEVGVALEAAQHEGDPSCFEPSTTVADAFLEKGAASCELGDLGLDEAALLLEAVVSDNLGIGFPIGQLVGRFCEGVEPSGPSGKELEEPGPHRVGRDA